MKKRILIILIPLLIINSICFSQPDSLWSKIYGEPPGVQSFADAKVTPDGGYIIAGHEMNNTHDFYVVKVDTDGDEEWTTVIHMGYRTSDFCRAVTITSDSGYVIAGWGEIEDYNGHMGLAAKLSQDGDSVWTQVYGGDRADEIHDCVSTNDGGLAFAGATTNFDAQGFDAWLIKTDSVGEIEWQRVYHAEGNEVIYSMVQTSDGGFALGGLTDSYGAGHYDFFLVKVDSIGEEQWRNAYGTESMDVCYDFIQTHDGGFMMTGHTTRGRTNKGYIVRTDAQGEQVYARTITRIDHESVFWSVLQTWDGGFIFGGDNVGHEEDDLQLIIRTDSSGQVLWFDGYGQGASELGGKVLATPDGGYAVIGTSWILYRPGGLRFWLVKTGVDPLSVPYILDPTYPQEYSLHLPYPNPFNSTVNIAFDLHRSKRIKISIIDNLGRELVTIVDGYYQEGRHHTHWEAESVPAGMYVAKMQVDKQNFFRKLMLVK